MAKTLAFPPRIINGAFQTVDQDTDAEIISSVDAVLLCPLGHRDQLPGYGLPPLEHTRLTTDRAAIVRAAVLDGEPRTPRVLTSEQIIGRASTLGVQVARA